MTSIWLFLTSQTNFQPVQDVAEAAYDNEGYLLGQQGGGGLLARTATSPGSSKPVLSRCKTDARATAGGPCLGTGFGKCLTVTSFFCHLQLQCRRS
ncbi:hypothetical protein DV737_g3903, partial [Chaetothyriales sp. CBS 132003]